MEEKVCRLRLNVRNLNESFEDKILSDIKRYWKELCYSLL